MMIFGSLRHTTSGRKKATTRSRKLTSTGTYTQPEPYRRETKHYPSLSTGVGVAPLVDRQEKLEISSKFTVAPAYNKGAYQVISPENIEHIGK